MPRALFLLLGLQAGAWLRTLTRNLRTLRGALLALLGLLVLVPWMIFLIWQRSETTPHERILMYGPAYMLGYCVLNVLLSSGERAVYFSPAEITFLFTGPFSRRQLLAYKILQSMLVALPATMFMTLLFRAQASWLPAAFVGVFLGVTFMHLFGMTLSLAASAVGARMFSRLRQILLGGVALAVVAFVILAGRSGHADNVLESEVWHVASTPLRWFFETFLAEGPLELLSSALRALLVNLLLLGFVFALDADYLESAAAFSARVYTRIQRLRGGSTLDVGADSGESTQARRLLPMLPRLAGIGPLIWRQLVSVVRSPGRIFVLVLLQVSLLVAALSGPREMSEALIFVVTFTMILSVFLTNLLPFDFRGDLDRLEALKTLPLPAWRLAVGQILTPTLILSLVQWLLLGALLILERSVSGVGPSPLPLLATFAAFLPSFNFLLFGLENVMFLLYPTRLAANSPGDFQALGRNLLMTMAKGFTLTLISMATFGVGFVVFHVNNHSAFLACLASWIVLTTGGAALVPVAAWAFERLDVTRDKPA